MILKTAAKDIPETLSTSTDNSQPVSTSERLVLGVRALQPHFGCTFARRHNQPSLR